MSNASILIIDDDLRLRQLLLQYLEKQGFQVADTPSADEAKSVLNVLSFDLIIMDYMMPGTSGPEMIRDLRNHGNQTPILMLTAMGEANHRIIGLESGADDYLAKPFDPRELVLRVQNILRRTQSSPSQNISFGTCLFDIKTGFLSKSGRGVSLTGSELELLRILSSQAGQVVSRETLAHLLNLENDRTIDVQIKRLREKIEEDVSHPLCIQTIRGQGYILMTA